MSVMCGRDTGRRRPFYFGDRQLLQSTCRGEELHAVDVRVARNCREVGVAEVLGDEARVAELLAEPGRGGVTERVRGDVLLDSRPFRCTADDLGEVRLLETSAGEAAEDRRFGARGARGSEGAKLACESGWERLPAGLAAFASADEQGRRGGAGRWCGGVRARGSLDQSGQGTSFSRPSNRAL